MQTIYAILVELDEVMTLAGSVQFWGRKIGPIFALTADCQKSIF
jgi:hypothetical protein